MDDLKVKKKKKKLKKILGTFFNKKEGFLGHV